MLPDTTKEEIIQDKKNKNQKKAEEKRKQNNSFSDGNSGLCNDGGDSDGNACYFRRISPRLIVAGVVTMENRGGEKNMEEKEKEERRKKRKDKDESLPEVQEDRFRNKCIAAYCRKRPPSH